MPRMNQAHALLRLYRITGRGEWRVLRGYQVLQAAC